MIFQQHVNRMPPKGPASAYITYAIDSPRDTLVRAACEQVGCDHWQRGWDVPADTSTPLGQAQAAYFRSGQSERTYREIPTGGPIVVFRFDSGQRCFRDHHTRPERFIRRGGDWRGNPVGDSYQHARAADWVEDSGEHLQEIAEAIRKG